MVRGVMNPTAVQRYAVGVLASVLAIAIKLLLDPALGKDAPFLVVLIGVLIAAWYGGLGPGLVAAVMTAAGVNYFFLPPYHTFSLGPGNALLQTVVYLLEGVFVSLLGEARKRTQYTLDARVRQQAAVADLGQHGLAGNDLSALMEEAARLVTRTLEVEYCEVLELLPDGAALRLVAGVGWKNGLVGRALVGSGRDSHGGYTLLSQGPVIVEDLLTETRFHSSPLLEEHGVVSGISVIIPGPGRPFGVLGAHTRQRRAFTTDDVRFFEAVANILAAAIQRQRSEDERSQLLQREQAARSLAEESEHRSQFLAEASNVLASSLDYPTTLASVAHLAVPRIGDWCSVHIVEDDGSVHALATEHVDPAKVELARALEHRYPFDPDAPGGAPQVLRTGESELITEITDEMIEAATPDDLELRNILQELGLRSSMVVPMVARDRTVGAITFVSAESGRLYHEADLRFAEELASHAALAVDNARLYRESLRIAAEQSAILGQMADGILIADPSGRVSYMNAAARRLLGLDGRKLETVPLREVLAMMVPEGQPVDEEASALARALQGEIVTNVDRRIRRLDGVEIVAQASAAPVVTEDGTRLGAVLAFRDVTALREIERQKDSFLAAAAHDLKTPLTTIKGLAQVLHRRATRANTPETAQLVNGLEQINLAVTRMNRLINELLDVSRARMGRPIELNRARTDIVALLRRVAAESEQANGRYHIWVEATVPELYGMWDTDRLERALGNLLSNAIKYSPAGGEITVTVRTEGDENDYWAVVAVRDRGLGIPSADLPHVFERFYRARNVGHMQGTGIGLAGVLQIVEQHGGTVSVESEEGVGSNFTVRLPASAPAERTVNA